jgi:hypothetical protein
LVVEWTEEACSG